MGWLVNVTPQPLYPPGKDPVPIVQKVGPRAGLDRCEKSRPHRDFFFNKLILRSPDRPARSQSLYRLSYRPTKCFRMKHYFLISEKYKV
jgi:hypothetical protein